MPVIILIIISLLTGLNPIVVVTELKNKHAQGINKAGINMKKVEIFIDNISEQH